MSDLLLEQNLISIPNTDLTTAAGVASSLECVKTGKSDFNLVMAQLMYLVRENELFLDWPGQRYETFEDWVKPVIEKSKSTAYAMISVYEVFCLNNVVAIDRLRRIGWAKLSRMCPFVTSENLEALLKMAESLSLFELQKELKKLKPQEEDSDSEKTHKIEYFDDQKDTVEAALELAGRLGETGSQAKQLEYICAAFCCEESLNNDQEHLERLINLLERKFNISIQITKNNNVVIDSVEYEEVE